MNRHASGLAVLVALCLLAAYGVSGAMTGGDEFRPEVGAPFQVIASSQQAAPSARNPPSEVTTSSEGRNPSEMTIPSELGLAGPAVAPASQLASLIRNLDEALVEAEDCAAFDDESYDDMHAVLNEARDALESSPENVPMHLAMVEAYYNGLLDAMAGVDCDDVGF